MTARQAVRTYLEMHDATDLQGAAAPSIDAIVERMEQCPPAVWRHLYTEVGREYHWVDRLTWTDEEIVAYLADPALELWIFRVKGTPAISNCAAMTMARSRSRISGCCRRSPARGWESSC